MAIVHLHCLDIFLCSLSLHAIYFVPQLHRASGRQQGFIDEIKKRERDLKSDMFRDADQKYRFKMIDLRVCFTLYRGLGIVVCVLIDVQS